MNRLLASILFGVFVCLHTSCQQEDAVVLNESGVYEQIPIEFVSIKHDELNTRAINTQWANGDSMGIFMKESGEALSLGSIYDNASNIKYTTDNSGNMSPGSHTLYYPHPGDIVDFIAYYPYNRNVTNFIYPVNVGTQIDLSRIDLLYSDNASGIDNTRGTVNMNFRHMLARVVITILIGPNAPGRPFDYNFSIHGFSSMANFSLIDGSFSNYNTPTSLFANPLDTNENVLTLLLLPSREGDTTDRYIQFLYANPTTTFSATWHIPANTLFESGKSYNYTLTITGQTTRSEGLDSYNVNAHLNSITDMNK